MIAALRLVPKAVWMALVAFLLASSAYQLVMNAKLRAEVADQKVVIAHKLQEVTQLVSVANRRHAEIARLTAEVSEINRAAEALASARAREIADVVIDKRSAPRALLLLPLLMLIVFCATSFQPSLPPPQATVQPPRLPALDSALKTEPLPSGAYLQRQTRGGQRCWRA